MSVRDASSRTESIKRLIEWKTAQAGYPKNKATAAGSFHTSAAIGGAVAAAEFGCCAQIDDFVYIVGQFTTNPLKIYNPDTTLSDISVTPAYQNKPIVYLVKYTLDGVPIWASKIETSSPFSNPASNDKLVQYPTIIASKDNSIYITAQVTGSSIKLYNTSSSTPNIIRTISEESCTIIAKYTNKGTALWVNYITNINAASESTGLAVDNNNNIYISALAQNDVNVYDSNNNIPVVSFLGYDAKLVTVKYTSSGEYIWATKIVDSLMGYGPYISCDNNNNLIVAGYYAGNLDIYEPDGSSPVKSLTPDGDSDNFLLKYDEDGLFQWATHIGGDSSKYVAKIAINSVGDIYISSYYSSNILKFYNETNPNISILDVGNSEAESSIDTYLAKYNSSGELQWASIIGGSSSEDNSHIVVDNNDNIIMSGASSSPILKIYNFATTMNPLPSPSTTIEFASTNNNAFLIKFDASGQYTWRTYIGDCNSPSRTALACNISGDIYIVGTYRNTTLNVYNSALLPLIILSGTALKEYTFLVKYNTNGEPQWAARNICISNSVLYPDISTAFKSY